MQCNENIGSCKTSRKQKLKGTLRADLNGKTEHPKVKKHLRKQGPKNLAKEGSEASGTQVHTKHAVEEKEIPNCE